MQIRQNEIQFQPKYSLQRNQQSTEQTIFYSKNSQLYFIEKRKEKSWKISLDWDFGRPNLISLFDGYENPFTNIPFYRNGKTFES